ncbi:MAG: monovalent cation/H(+) antiporter subunit G [Pseudomonadota bacterium]
MLAQIVDIASFILMTAGGFFVFVGGVGALRMPDLYTRMHAASVTDSIGPILIIAGVMLQSGVTLASVKLAAILLFLLLTGPTASNALASAALLSGQEPNARSIDPDNDSDNPS